jgi:hypothetical protein
MYIYIIIYIYIQYIYIFNIYIFNIYIYSIYIYTYAHNITYCNMYIYICIYIYVANLKCNQTAAPAALLVMFFEVTGRFSKLVYQFPIRIPERLGMKSFSLDWFTGNFTGNHRFSHSIWSFLVKIFS